MSFAPKWTLSRLVRRRVLRAMQSTNAEPCNKPFFPKAQLLHRLKDQLHHRAKEGKLRTISSKFDPTCEVDFASNDYLGLARDRRLCQTIDTATRAYVTSQSTCVPVLGSTGSRLLTGHSPLFEEVEAYIARFHGQPLCLLANSGWDLNCGILSCVPSSHSIVLYDELSHNSLIVGTRLGRQSASKPFKHNSVDDLAYQLNACSRTHTEKIIVVESVYSMDGDICPLGEVLQVAEAHDAMVLVDEAHGTGVLGKRGEGLVSSLGLQRHPNLLGVVHTFGKGVGVHGAALLTQYEDLLQTIANYCQPFIYSTSLPIPSLIAIREAYRAMGEATSARMHLEVLIRLFREQCTAHSIPIFDSTSPIQAVRVPSNHAVLAAAAKLREMGFGCLPIRAPTVPEGQERIRVILHAHNTTDQINGLCNALKGIVAR